MEGDQRKEKEKKSSTMLKKLESCISIGRRVAPTTGGCFSVYVGREKQRFVIRTEFANHPLFRMLLEDAELEYGFTSEGPLLLPCEVDLFCKVLAEMDGGGGGGGGDFDDRSSSGSCSPFSQRRRTEKGGGVAPTGGCFSVYVGREKQRFVIRTEFANHPLFRMLLEDAELEYGFTSEGPLLLPCEADLFCKVLAEMDGGGGGDFDDRSSSGSCSPSASGGGRRKAAACIDYSASRVCSR